MVFKPATFIEVMAIATRLIDMDEDRRLRQDDDKAPPRNDDKFGFRRFRPQRPFPRGSEGGPTFGFRKEVDNNNYTPLNASRSKVLMWIRANGVGIPRPGRMDLAQRESVDRRFYCQYHRDYGHDTDECRELQKAIE